MQNQLGKGGISTNVHDDGNCPSQRKFTGRLFRQIHSKVGCSYLRHTAPHHPTTKNFIFRDLSLTCFARNDSTATIVGFFPFVH